MADRFYDVEIIVTKNVRVRVPDNALDPPTDCPIEAAEEFALGGASSWPDYVMHEDADHQVETVTQVTSANAPNTTG